MDLQGVSDINIPPVGTEAHLLISSVRQSYLKFLQQLVCQNYIHWCGERPPPAVLHCAKHLELISAAQAMVVPLYREAVLKVIKNLKQYTCSKKLFPELERFCLNSQFQNKAVQTDFSDGVANENVENTRTSEVLSSERVAEDDVMMEMEKLFQSASADNDEDIFDSISCDTYEMQRIMEDLNKYANNNQKDKVIDTQINKNTVIDTQTSKNMVIDTQINESNITQQGTANPLRCSIVSSSQKEPKKSYLYSEWPCEAFYQRKKLFMKMDCICEQNIKRHSKIKSKFIELFGYDSDDETGLQSPDTSVEFLRSCRQRAVPFLTKHLQKYSEKVRVPKHLVKPLAKHLLYALINVNQYPSDYECYLFLRDYFRMHPNIKCQADF